MNKPRAKIDFVYIDSGGGHRATAIALDEMIRREKRPWDVRMRSVQDMLDPIDLVRKVSGVPQQEVYNILLRRGWTLGTAQMIRLMHLVIRLQHRAQVRLMAEFWSRNKPDMVVSLIPNFNRAMFDALAVAAPGVPLVTVLTDLADYPPNFWIEKQPQYFVCGTARSVEQARALGHAEDRILRTSGMILHPRFYECAGVDRDAEREKLGLRAGVPTGVVLFGGEGTRDIVKTVRALNRPGMDLQLIVLCGKHRSALEEVRAMRQHIPIHAEGFTREIPRFMALSDFFIGKPGPGSISEALAMGLPVIVERNIWTLVQERFNAEWVAEQGIGIVIDDLSKSAEAVKQLLAPENYEAFRRKALASRSFAVFETPAMLEAIMEHHFHGASMMARRQVIGVQPEVFV